MSDDWSGLPDTEGKGNFLRTVGSLLNPIAWVYSGFGTRKEDAFGKGERAPTTKEYSPPYFQKSYSAFDQLSPFIKVFVKIPLSNTDKLQAKEQKVSFFDIPYNYIKSLKLESKYGDSNLDLVTLTLEDPSGSISTIMFAHLNMLAVANGPVGGGLPEITIQYGWGGGNPFKIKTKGSAPIAYLETELKEYTIKSADISYENMKQKMVLTANPKNVGVAYEFTLSIKPFKWLNSLTPLDDLIRNRFLSISEAKYNAEFKVGRKDGSRVADSGLQDFKFDTSDKLVENNNAETFYKENKFLIKSINNNKNNLFIRKQDLKISNRNYKDEDKPATIDPKNPKKPLEGETSFDTKRLSNYAKAKLHPYLVFCYYLSHYIACIKSENNDIKVFVLPMYKEDNIFAWQNHYFPPATKNYPTDWEKTFQEYLFREGQKLATPGSGVGQELKYEIENTEWLTRENSIKDTTTWDEILLEIGKKVKIKIYQDKKNELAVPQATPQPKGEPSKPPVKSQIEPIKYHTLHFQTINIPKKQGQSVSNSKITEERRKQTKKQIEFLIKNEEKLNQAQGKYRFDKKFLDYLLTTVGKEEKDILIIIINENAFSLKSSEGNLPLQSYTVFPKIDITRKFGDTFFNAGSKNLKEESYPDVISFSPKINFKELVNVMISQANNLNGDYYKNIPLISHSTSRIRFLKEGAQIPTDDKLSITFIPTPEEIQAINDFFKDLNDAIINNINFSLFHYNDGWFRIAKDTAELKCRTVDSLKASLADKSILYGNENKNKLIEFKFPKLKNKEADTTETANKKILQDIYDDFIKFVNVEKNKEMSGMISKAFDTTEDVFPGEPSSISYNKMVMQQKNFYEILKRSNYSFDAELKILGEPAYSYNWGTVPVIQLNVNAPDGTPNVLCSGNYQIISVVQDIDGGKFTTTLQLKFEWESTNRNQNK